MEKQIEGKEIIGYRCNVNYDDQFTKGKLYYLNPGKTIKEFGAFTDDKGLENGFGHKNHKHFEPVYKEDDTPNSEPTLTSYLPYNLGIDFEKLKESKSHLIKLLALDGNLENNYILELIDSIQDYAVDNHNLPRNQVFNVEEEFGI